MWISSAPVDILEHPFDAGPVDATPDRPPPPLTRITRQEAATLDPDRIRRVDPPRPAVYWTGTGLAPASILAWARVYEGWWVRLRTRRDIWRDREAWYLYAPGRLLPLEVDQRDAQEWMPKRDG